MWRNHNEARRKEARKPRSKTQDAITQRRKEAKKIQDAKEAEKLYARGKEVNKQDARCKTHPRSKEAKKQRSKEAKKQDARCIAAKAEAQRRSKTLGTKKQDVKEASRKTQT